MPAERWLPIEGWPYEVSDHGRVRRSSPACGTRPGRVRRLGRTKRGYLGLSLSDSPRRSQIVVHRLVAAAFIIPPRGPTGRGADEYQINHRDGDKANNTPANLEWVTPAENYAHAVRMGLMARGERHWNAILTTAGVTNIRTRLRAGDRQQDIATALGVSARTISDIKNDRTWRHTA